MPELPEVETVRRSLLPLTVGKTFAVPEVYVRRAVLGDIDAYKKRLTGRKILSLERKGKYLVFQLDGNMHLLFHLRMEGKLYLVDRKRHSDAHLSLLLPFLDSPDALAFYDTRKFGLSMAFADGEKTPLDKVGKDPLDDVSGLDFYRLYHPYHKHLKTLLLDQSLISGIGNIYSDEICFASGLSPFRYGDSLTPDEGEKLFQASRKILTGAIRHHGTTVFTFQASNHQSGEFQNELQVYHKEGTLCPRCKKDRIAMVFLNGRSTHYCAHCQKTGLTLGITGKIGSGKSLVTSYFKSLGYLTLSADEIVHSLYRDKAFLLALKKKFPQVVGTRLKKKTLTKLLFSSPKFKKAYTNYIFSAVREKTMAFIIAHDGLDKAVEVPLLFDAHMEPLFSSLIGVETTRQKEHLLERGDQDVEKRISFNQINSYDRNRYKLDFVLTTDGTKEELFEKVRKLSEELHR